MAYECGIGYGRLNSIFPGFPMFMQLILFLMFLAIVYWIIKSGNISNGNAQDILKKRLAEGKITKKEYKELSKEIQK